MTTILDFIRAHGVPVILVIFFLDQVGVPLPSIPLLLALGAMAGAGKLDVVTAFMAALGGSVVADALWYEVGRWKGTKALAFLCRMSLEPDTCVSQTQNMFAKHGVKSLVLAKFIPGFDTLAPPLAGILAIRRRAFLPWTAAGGVVWLVTFGGLGYLLSNRISAIVAGADRFSGALGWAVLGLLALWIGWKFAQRQRVLRQFREARITPEQLHELVTGGHDPVIVDVRIGAALDILPLVIPGALLITYEEVDARHAEIPRDRDVIVYCS